MHIRILYDNDLYGPFDANTTINDIKISLGIPDYYSSVLKSVLGEVIIHNNKQIIPAGFYEFLVDSNHTDYQPPKEIIKPNNQQNQTTTRETASQTVMKREESLLKLTTFPLAVGEMNYCVESMLHLLATIPPRYTKYNKVLSKQIDVSLKEVETWLSYADRVRNGKEDNALQKENVSPEDFLTFLQYRVLNIMYDVWKRVWARYSPNSRLFSVSELYTLNSIDRVEHILNCLSSWRRILETRSWKKIQSFVDKNPIGNQQNSIPAIFYPSRLPSNEHSGDFVHLTQNRNNIFSPLDKNQELKKFKKDFIHELAERGEYKNIRLKELLGEMVSKMESQYSGSLEGGYPSNFIKQSIMREFMIFD